MDESTLAVLDGRKSAGLGHGGVAGLETARRETGGQRCCSWTAGVETARLETSGQTARRETAGQR